MCQPGTAWILDVGFVCPGTQRYVGQGSQTTPGRAAEAYAALKAAKYADQPNAADSRTQEHFRGPSPQEDVALRGVMQALARSYPNARRHCGGGSRGR